MAHQHATSDYMAHGFCFSWEPGLVGLHVASDIITGIAYYSITLAMLYCAYKRRDITLHALLIVFAIFIMACGTTHFFAAYTVYFPTYWVEGYFKALTSLISVASAAYFIPQIPKVLAMPSLENSLAQNQELNSQLQKTVNELQKSNALSQSIIDSSTDCIILLDLEGRLQYMNHVGQLLLGIKDVENYLELSYEEFWSGAYREVALEAIAKARQGNPANFEGQCPTTDGTPKWWDVIITPVKGPDGNPEYLLAVSRDITERKHAQSVIQLNESRLESLLRISQYDFTTAQDLLDFALNEAILLTESRIGYLYFYDEQQQEFTLNSWSKEVMKECGIAEYHMVYPLKDTGIWGEAVRQRRPVIINDFQADHPLKRGCPEAHVPMHSFLTIPVFNRDMIVAVVGVANKVKEYNEADVRQLTLMMDAVWKMAEQARTDQALLSAETKFRNLLESIQLLALILDTAGNITFCNDYLLNLTGWTRDEIMGSNGFDLFIPENEREQTKSTFKANISIDAVSAHFENVFLMRNGKQRLIVWNRTVLHGAEGNVIGIAFIGNDVTEHRRTEEQLRQSLKMESIGRLAGGVAHDFNNMLSVILGYTEMAQLDLSEGDPLLENMREISKAAERSRNITRQLLAFSRKELISPRTLDLNALIADTGKTLTRLIGEDIQLATCLAADLWAIRIDPSQIDQILVNLAVNARDAMPRGGRLAIETANARLDDVYCYEFLEAQPGEYVQLSLKDNGIGMDPQTLEYIFEPFYTTKEIGKGTGLGLATVYGIVSQNKGFIHVESAPDKGTTFRIYFPRSAEEKPQEAQTEDISCSGSGIILLVEDEEAVRRMTAIMLEIIGYTVLQAETPEIALLICEKMDQKIDLLLTDVIMPAMSGKEMYEIIKGIRPGLKVLFMSGYTADVIAQRTVLENDVNFIQKPFEMSTLGNKVKEILE